MSSMNFMEKLLDGIAVEWKALGELAANLDSMRKPITSGLRDPGDIPYYGASGIVDYVKDYIFDGDFLLVSEDGANLLARSTPIAFSIGGKSWVNNHAHVLKFETYAERRYVEFYLNSIDLTPYISGAAQPKLNQTNLNSISIPNPSPEEKERIVAILDAFTELTAELTARKKQYNYYRDQLLSFEEGKVEWKALGELCSISVGQAPAVNEVGEYPFVNAGTTPSGYVPAYNTEPGTITTPSRGQGGIGYVGYQTTRFWCGPLCYRICSTSEMLLTRFLYHVMANSMKEIVGLANMTGVPALNKKDLVGFPVPIPSPDEQERIVAILDKFDALTNSISEGLPREIELRQKQYEYYCDLLLSFPKPEEVAA